jgi:hypothetical protein
MRHALPGWRAARVRRCSGCNSSTPGTWSSSKRWSGSGPFCSKPGQFFPQLPNARYCIYEVWAAKHSGSEQIVTYPPSVSPDAHSTSPFRFAGMLNAPHVHVATRLGSRPSRAYKCSLHRRLLPSEAFPRRCGHWRCRLNSNSSTNNNTNSSTSTGMSSSNAMGLASSSTTITAASTATACA